MHFQEKLRIYILTGNPAISINTFEEGRVTKIVKELMPEIVNEKGEPKYTKTYQWDFAQGLAKDYDLESAVNQSTIQYDRTFCQPAKVFDDINPYNKICVDKYQDSIVFLLDFGAIPLEQNPDLVRSLKNAVIACTKIRCCLVFVGPRFAWPVEVEKIITHLDFDLPTEEELAESITKLVTPIEKKYGKKLTTPNDIILASQAGKGLTLGEIKRAAAFSMGASKKLDINLIMDEKVNTVKKAGLLEIMNTEGYNMDTVGGLDNLKNYLENRKNTFDPDAAKFGLPYPRGILMVGIPGGGKSHIAKCIANLFGIPLIKFDIGNLMNGIVGGTEAQVRLSLKQVTAISPCVGGDTVLDMVDSPPEKISNLFERLLANTELLKKQDTNDTEIFLNTPLKIYGIDPQSGERVVNDLLSVIKRKHENDLIEITLDSGETLTVTQNHKVLVKDNGNMVYKYADELHQDDEIVKVDID